MKAEELMIYNYVTFKGTISKVVAILPPYLYLRDVKGNPIYSIHETNLKPIEITEELLLKNGFRKDGMGYFKYYDHNDAIYVKSTFDYSCIEYAKLAFNPEDVTETDYGSSFEYPNKLHIHTLQNIWYLCTGKLLELKL